MRRSGALAVLTGVRFERRWFLLDAVRGAGDAWAGSSAASAPTA